MRMITRYILRQLTTGTLLVAAGLAVILWLTQSLRLIETIISKGLGMGTFISMTMLLMPSFLVIVLPIALFAVILFTYNRLNGDRELVVMRAVGLGPFGLARPALLLAFVLMLVTYGLTLYVAPLSVETFRETRWKVRNDVAGLVLEAGAFNELEENLTVYVRDTGPDDTLIGLLIHDKRDVAAPVTVMAERGALVQPDSGPPRILMENGNRQEVTPGTGQLSLLYFDRHVMELGSLGGDAGPRYRDARERPLLELLTTTASNESETRKFRVEAHQRLASPLLNISFALIALATMLTGPFNRHGQGRRVIGGVSAMILAQSFGLAAVNLASDSLTLIPLIYVAAIVPGLIALGILARASSGGKAPPVPRATTAGGPS
ncbi:LPS export ABC transporter permease LptF [Caenispirillum salinarum]|nr:LPS export ABC transporter permease LptF [Caenispirillum salinarum]